MPFFSLRSWGRGGRCANTPHTHHTPSPSHPTPSTHTLPKNKMDPLLFAPPPRGRRVCGCALFFSCETVPSACVSTVTRFSSPFFISMVMPPFSSSKALSYDGRLTLCWEWEGLVARMFCWQACFFFYSQHAHTQTQRDRAPFLIHPEGCTSFCRMHETNIKHGCKVTHVR